MAVVTRQEVNEILQLSAADRVTYQSLIDLYIPMVQEDICLYCDRYFEDPVIYRKASSGIAFVRGDTDDTSTQADTITDDDAEFSTNDGAGFRGDMDIIIMGSGSNDGFYTLASVSSGTLTLNTTGELESWDQDDYYTGSGQRVHSIIISRIIWPQALKPIAARMIWYQISKAKMDDIQSERIDDYAVTYAGNNLYPERLVRGLEKFRYARMR